MTGAKVHGLNTFHVATDKLTTSVAYLLRADNPLNMVMYKTPCQDVFDSSAPSSYYRGSDSFSFT